MQTFTLRPFGRHDYLPLVGISKAVYGDGHESADEWRHADPQYRHSQGALRYVALCEATGKVAGYGSLGNEPWLDQQRKRRLELLVHPEHQRCGFGTALYEQLIQDVPLEEVAALETRVREDKPSSLEFLGDRGFAERERSWKLELAVAEADLSPLEEAVRRLKAGGIQITTLAEEKALDPDSVHRLHSLWLELSADQPGYDPDTAPQFLEFVQWLASPNRPSEACFIARAGDAYVGMSMLMKRAAEPGTLTQNLTGSVRSHRRRGIATALKLCTIRYAREHGYERILTASDSLNAPALALNEKLGFRRQVGWVTLEKALCA
jgi:GNAT superfamily N-acetyltransferase